MACFMTPRFARWQHPPDGAVLRFRHDAHCRGTLRTFALLAGQIAWYGKHYSMHG
jgi:hypothetical protein